MFQFFSRARVGAVGGLAHHPVVGVCVGESGGGAALRRGLVGALAKPLSATADLVAYAGQGLLAQTGWDSPPQVCFFLWSRHTNTAHLMVCSPLPMNIPNIERFAKMWPLR